jgi:midasin (ATPase involved in ribosome maturation)
MKGSSQFQWVDSVLLEAITEGHWAVFENANICNPSILDRLNPLLEEGNNSLVINEQGLDSTNQSLRVVKAHENFRALFIVTEKSFSDQGKDVSRALRNRCVEISLHFGAEQSSI